MEKIYRPRGVGTLAEYVGWAARWALALARAKVLIISFGAL